MNSDEIVRLIATCRAACPGMSLVEGMPEVWHGALGDLRLLECEAAVMLYTREHREIITPADIRRLVRASRHDAAMRALPAGSDGLVGMPDWFRSSVAEHRKRAAALKDQRREAGDPVTFGAAIVHAFDGRLR